VVRAYLLVFAGAGLGGILRHLINVVAVRGAGVSLPVSTALINISGSLALGLLAGYFALRMDPGQSWRLFLTTGLLGGFTTFSAFSLDAALLSERGDLGAAALYVGGSVLGSILAVFAGLWLMRQLVAP
jgi:fluoride exporter